MDKNTTNDAGNAQAASQQSGQVPPPNTTQAVAGENSTSAPTTISAEEVQRQLKELRRENQTLRNKAKEQDDAASTAQAAALAEQGRYKELYERADIELKALKATVEQGTAQHTDLVQQHTTLASLIASQIEEEIKEWPASVKALDPGKDALIEARMAWRNNARAIVAEMQQQQRGQAPGNAPGPKPGAQTLETRQQEQIEKMRRSGLYGR